MSQPKFPINDSFSMDWANFQARFTSHNVSLFPIAKYLHGLYYFILLGAILKGLYTRTQVTPQRYILSSRFKKNLGLTT
jgi:hypothetical protein